MLEPGKILRAHFFGKETMTATPTVTFMFLLRDTALAIRDRCGCWDRFLGNGCQGIGIFQVQSVSPGSSITVIGTEYIVLSSGSSAASSGGGLIGSASECLMDPLGPPAAHHPLLR